MKFDKQEIIAKKRYIWKENLKYPEDSFVLVPESQWPPGFKAINHPDRVWRSRGFLVQVFGNIGESDKPVRLSINRTAIDDDGMWIADISWEELQWVKNKCGYENFDAVEVFPRERDVVNVAKIRHLWIMPEPLPFAWRDRKVF